MKDYLAGLTRRRLSKRQAILVQHIDRCMSDLERIGDHIETLCTLSLRRKKVPEAIVDADSFGKFFQLYESVLHILRQVSSSFDPDRDDIREIADQILQARDDYLQASLDTRTHFNEKVSQREITPTAGIFFSEYIAALDRIVRHARNIALSEQQPQFWIKRSKLDKHMDWPPSRRSRRWSTPRTSSPASRTRTIVASSGGSDRSQASLPP